MDLNQPQDALNIEAADTPIVSTSAYPDIKATVWLFFVLLFYMLIIGIAEGFLMAMLDLSRIRLPLLESFLSLTAYIISVFLVIRYAIKKSRKQSDSSLGISFNKMHSILIPVLVISTLALVVFLERVSTIIPMPVSVQKFFERAFRKDVFSIITMVLAAPVLEEIFCRGIVLRGLLKNYPPNRAIIISAIFFAAIHMNPWQALPAFFGGLFLGWVYYRTKSVVPGMIIHATINTAAAILLFLPKNQQDFLSLLGLPYYIILCFLSILIFVMGCIIIDRRTIFPISN